MSESGGHFGWHSVSDQPYVGEAGEKNGPTDQIKSSLVRCFQSIWKTVWIGFTVDNAQSFQSSARVIMDTQFHDKTHSPKRATKHLKHDACQFDFELLCTARAASSSLHCVQQPSNFRLVWSWVVGRISSFRLCLFDTSRSWWTAVRAVQDLGVRCVIQEARPSLCVGVRGRPRRRLATTNRQRHTAMSAHARNKQTSTRPNTSSSAKPHNTHTFVVSSSVKPRKSQVLEGVVFIG